MQTCSYDTALRYELVITTYTHTYVYVFYVNTCVYILVELGLIAFHIHHCGKCICVYIRMNVYVCLYI